MVKPTPSKNITSSNWIISPDNPGENDKIFELPPPFFLYIPVPRGTFFVCFSQKPSAFESEEQNIKHPKALEIPAASTSTSTFFFKPTGHSPWFNQTKGARIVPHRHPVRKVGFRHIVTRIRRDDHVKSQNPHWWPQEIVFFWRPWKRDGLLGMKSGTLINGQTSKWVLVGGVISSLLIGENN